MRRLIICLLATVLTFLIGLSISHLLMRPAEPESIQPLATKEPILVEPQITQSPDLPRKPDFPEGSDLAVAIQVSQPNPNPPIYVLRYIKLAKHGTTIVVLDLAEYLDDSEVTLNLRDTSATYRILQRYRTSMTIDAEGPHLDLTDWRHFDSAWTSLKSHGPNRFRTAPFDELDVEFPKASQADIVKEVRRRVGNDWPLIVELAKHCSGPNDGACLVSISSMYLKIQKQVGDRWIDAGLVEFQLPMGC